MSRLSVARRGLTAAALLMWSGAGLMADEAAQKVTPLAVNPVVLPTPDVPSTPLTAAPEAPAPKVAKKATRGGKASSTKAKAPGRSKPAHPVAKKRAQRK